MAGTDAWRAAADRAAAFTQGYQRRDGGYDWEGYAPDAFHKQSNAWGLNGRVAAAQRLLQWIRRERLLPDGEVRGYGTDVYKYAWLVQGAHRLGRFDVSLPIYRAALRQRQPCGAFPMKPGAHCRVLPTCWLGVAAVYLGDLDTARAALAWAQRLFAAQPEAGRFYFETDAAGKLLTGDGALHIDDGQPEQCYWEIGLPLQLACRLHMATGDAADLDLARALFARHLACHADAFTSTSSGKSALGAALLYALTGDAQARDRAAAFADHLVATQLPAGGWRNPAWPAEILYEIDAAAEFSVWLCEVAALLDCR